MTSIVQDARTARPAPVAVAALVAAMIVAQTWFMGRAVVLLDVALGASYVLWASRARPAERTRVVGPFSLAIAVQVVHLAEEYRTGFQRAFPAIFGYVWEDWRFLAFNVAWLVVLAASAMLVARGRRIGYLAAWFLAIGGGIGNGIGHLALAARAGGYFPGAWTAPLALAAGGLLLSRLLERAPET